MNGERINAAGIQSVMTHPNFRRQGLMTQLMSKMIEEIDKKCECTLLFTENLNYIHHMVLKLCRSI